MIAISKERGIHTGPMSGFEKDEFTKRFYLPENIVPLVFITTGYASKPTFGSSRLDALKIQLIFTNSDNNIVRAA